MNVSCENECIFTVKLITALLKLQLIKLYFLYQPYKIKPASLFMPALHLLAFFLFVFDISHDSIFFSLFSFFPSQGWNHTLNILRYFLKMEEKIKKVKKHLEATATGSRNCDCPQLPYKRSRSYPLTRSWALIIGTFLSSMMQREQHRAM